MRNVKVLKEIKRCKLMFLLIVNYLVIGIKHEIYVVVIYFSSKSCDIYGRL